MNIINNLVLGTNGNEQKFVVIVLANGDMYFCTAPLYEKRDGGIHETRHKEIVARFCDENDFTPNTTFQGAIRTAINADGVKLEVDGGGSISTYRNSILSGNMSGDYGIPSRGVVEHCIREAMKKEGLDDLELLVRQVREE